MLPTLDCQHTRSNAFAIEHLLWSIQYIMTQITDFTIFFGKLIAIFRQRIQLFYEGDIFLTHSVEKFSNISYFIQLQRFTLHNSINS